MFPATEEPRKIAPRDRRISLPVPTKIPPVGFLSDRSDKMASPVARNRAAAIAGLASSGLVLLLFLSGLWVWSILVGALVLIGLVLVQRAKSAARSAGDSHHQD